MSYIITYGRKVTVYNDHKNVLLPYWRNLLKITLLDSLYTEWIVESLDMKSTSSMLKAKISLLQMPWADLKRLTKTKARSNKRLKWPDLFTKIKAYNKPLISGNVRSNCAGCWPTVCNPLISMCWILCHQTFLLKFYPIRALNMNCHLEMQSYTGMIAY